MTRKINLPPITAHDHPECMSMKWSVLELVAIKRYATAAVLADRAELAKPEQPEQQEPVASVYVEPLRGPNKTVQRVEWTALTYLQPGFHYLYTRPAELAKPEQQERKPMADAESQDLRDRAVAKLEKSSPASATEDDMDSLRHMLGVRTDEKKSTWGYRNYFAAGAGHIASLERLVAAGYVTRGRTTDRMTYYHATEAGMDAIGLSKAAKRRAMEP